MLRAVRESNDDTGGRSVEMAGHEYVIRGRGYVKDVEDLAKNSEETPSDASASDSPASLAALAS